jgi:PAS domain S-box-containing protein
MDEKLKALQDELAQVKQQLADKEKELAERNQVFEALANNTIVAYWEWDIIQNKEYLSSSFMEMFGYDPEQIRSESKSWRDIIHEEDLIKVDQLFNRCLENELNGYHSCEVRYIHKNGTIIDVYCSGKVIARNEENHPTKMVGSHINISPLKKVQRRLMETTKLLAHQNKQLHDFAYITTHNLRSPIGNLVSLHELYKICSEQKDKEEMVDKLEEVSLQLLHNVNDLSDSLKEQQDKQYQEIAFQDVCDNVLRQLSTFIENKNAQIDISFQEKASIAYPKIYLESILLNLVSNALKYSSTKRSVELSISTRVENHKTKLIVSDNGQGIDMDKYSHQLFGLYNTFHKNPDAKGIGLFITKTQIESLGGSIHVDSTPDVGTTFTITF